MSRSRIAYIVTNCKKTGPMNQTLNIIRNLDRKLFDPVLITLFPEVKSNTLLEEFKTECSSIHCLNMNKYQSILIGKKKLNGLLAKIKPDLIQGVGMPPYTMSLSYRDTKHLVTLRNYCYEDYPAKYGKVLGPIIANKDMRLIRRQSNNGEVFVTCSSSLSKIYKDKHGLNFGFIRNGVDITRYSKTSDSTRIDMRTKLNLPLNKTIAIYTGQINERKDQKSAIDGVLAAKDKDNLVLLLLGAGSNYEALKERYKSSSNIVFVGSVSNVSDYLQAADFYISTSKSEGMPNGVLEAMSVGLPVLLSDIPQHKELFDISNDIGLMYRLGDMSSLVNTINGMMQADLAKMAEISYHAVTGNLTAQIMSNSYQKLYNQILQLG
ncbi:glycosyltransferase [Paenibacillus sp. PR3]|uniref:Glycosyltransferase n=1 Tax=Paenibacillus terricola TaxID=2763503 RepID=A0ABR8N2K6_9BACL|nr:glycosyltransferase [Paenibacillus terricola]MBD3921516.1 glycosyltransferase [Paenibacillus terricola]